MSKDKTSRSWQAEPNTEQLLKELLEAASTSNQVRSEMVMKGSKSNIRLPAKGRDQVSIDSLKDEYKDVAENIRHWQNMRFAHLTVFFVIIASLMSVTFQLSNNITDITRITMRLAGILLVIIFWVLDERVVKYWKHFMERAREIEKVLEYRQYSNTPPRGLITSGNAIRLLFFNLLIFWAVTVIWHSKF